MNFRELAKKLKWYNITPHIKPGEWDEQSTNLYHGPVKLRREVRRRSHLSLVNCNIICSCCACSIYDYNFFSNGRIGWKR